jgi:CHAP domain/Putative peptidoglycan binding domain
VEVILDYPAYVVKIGETNSDLVKAIAARLRAKGYEFSSPAGEFDAALKSTIKLFQNQHYDAVHRPLKPDGEVGPLTWSALFDVAIPSAAASSLALAALNVAISQIGIMENPLGSNRGPEVDQYLRNAGASPGEYWCMSFVYWCFTQAAKQMAVVNTFPKTPSCLEAWSLAKAMRINKAQAVANPGLVSVGSIFIIDHGGGKGHTGFVREPLGGAFRSIEGNSNPNGSSNGIGVFDITRRSVMDLQLKGFIIIS